jgi:hypothetical protein
VAARRISGEDPRFLAGRKRLWVGLAEQDSYGIRLHVECGNSGREDGNAVGYDLICSSQSEQQAADFIDYVPMASRPVDRTNSL